MGGRVMNYDVTTGSGQIRPPFSLKLRGKLSNLALKVGWQHCPGLEEETLQCTVDDRIRTD
jgi:hypothetical protein